ncbi:MAG: hypothetical protein HQK54_14495, partial [Oligoflexales bacterium]|nr:hypothetical protein [Oligoflexales bacterium]
MNPILSKIFYYLGVILPLACLIGCQKEAGFLSTRSASSGKSAITGNDETKTTSPAQPQGGNQQTETASGEIENKNIVATAE